MNYEPNRIVWKSGDVVIHDADAKDERMLMEVLGSKVLLPTITKPPIRIFFTRYIYPAKIFPKNRAEQKRMRKRIYENEMGFLHDPKIFGITVKGNGRR